MPTPGFPSLGTTDILSWIIPCHGGCPVPYRVFTRVPGLYLLDASVAPTPQGVTVKNVTGHC